MSPSLAAKLPRPQAVQALLPWPTLIEPALHCGHSAKRNADQARAMSEEEEAKSIQVQTGKASGKQSTDTHERSPWHWLLCRRRTAGKTTDHRRSAIKNNTSSESAQGAKDEESCAAFEFSNIQKLSGCNVSSPGRGHSHTVCTETRHRRCTSPTSNPAHSIEFEMNSMI